MSDQQWHSFKLIKMNCPNCKSNEFSVIDSRDCDEGIRRRRLCAKCDLRFTTYERIEKPIVVVIKKDNRRERFSKEKLTRGILQACKNRPIDKIVVDRAVDDIEKQINILGEEEVTSHYIGEQVLDTLKGIDQVAYLRFASVHKSFNDLRAFEREISRLDNKK